MTDINSFLQYFSQYPLVCLSLGLCFYWFSKIEALQKQLKDLTVNSTLAIEQNTQVLNEIKTLIINNNKN
jgi:hypothetical protein